MQKREDMESVKVFKTRQNRFLFGTTLKYLVKLTKYVPNCAASRPLRSSVKLLWEIY
jgi:hypothetical protein